MRPAARARGGEADAVELDRQDRAWYRTVYQAAGGQMSVAAPTAGLHFTQPLLDRLDAGGIELVRLQLEVGPGTFKPVTAARRYIAKSNLVPPALVNVRRNEHTTDRFFWGEKGLFSAQYAEENHFLFPSLRTIVDSVGEDTIFAGLEATSDDWEEMEEYEYAFV